MSVSKKERQRHLKALQDLKTAKRWHLKALAANADDAPLYWNDVCAHAHSAWWGAHSQQMPEVAQEAKDLYIESVEFFVKKYRDEGTIASHKWLVRLLDKLKGEA